MKRAMILFAKGFPYNVSEPFLEKEYPKYGTYFDHVLVVTGCKKGEKPTRQVEDDTLEFINDYTLSGDVCSILQAVPLMLSDRMFYREIAQLVREKRFTFGRLRQLFSVSLCGNHRALQARKWMRCHPEYQVDVIYSYWLQITAYAAVRLKQLEKLDDAFSISRTHRFDLYAERIKSNYLPFQGQLVERLDEIASISLDGKQYLESKYGTNHNISICHLGAQDRGITNPASARNTLRIVSCARAVPIKRLDRIAEALKKIKDIPIEWTHIGGGECLDSIREAACGLPDNIHVKFTGTVSNDEVYQIYSVEPFHVFINVSKSEGVPVSIMEAMSFSIPVIATAVGGTAELVDEGENGFLLDENFRTEELVALLYRFYKMQEEEYVRYRMDARSKFKAQYDAEHNYAEFVKGLAEKTGKKI